MAQPGTKTTEKPATMAATGRWHSAADLADRYRVDVKSIWRWAANGNLPRGTKLSKGCTRWSDEAISDWEASR